MLLLWCRRWPISGLKDTSLYTYCCITNCHTSHILIRIFKNFQIKFVLFVLAKLNLNPLHRITSRAQIYMKYKVFYCHYTHILTVNIHIDFVVPTVLITVMVLFVMVILLQDKLCWQFECTNSFWRLQGIRIRKRIVSLYLRLSLNSRIIIKTIIK